VTRGWILTLNGSKHVTRKDVPFLCPHAGRHHLGVQISPVKIRREYALSSFNWARMKNDVIGVARCSVGMPTNFRNITANRTVVNCQIAIKNAKSLIPFIGIQMYTNGFQRTTTPLLCWACCATDRKKFHFSPVCIYG